MASDNLGVPFFVLSAPRAFVMPHAYAPYQQRHSEEGSSRGKREEAQPAGIIPAADGGRRIEADEQHWEHKAEHGF